MPVAVKTCLNRSGPPRASAKNGVAAEITSDWVRTFEGAAVASDISFAAGCIITGLLTIDAARDQAFHLAYADAFTFRRAGGNKGHRPASMNIGSRPARAMA